MPLWKLSNSNFASDAGSPNPNWYISLTSRRFTSTDQGKANLLVSMLSRSLRTSFVFSSTLTSSENHLDVIEGCTIRENLRRSLPLNKHNCLTGNDLALAASLEPKTGLANLLCESARRLN